MTRVITGLASAAGALALLAGLPAAGAAQTARAQARPPVLAALAARLDRLLPAGAPRISAATSGAVTAVNVRRPDLGWAVGLRCPGGCGSGPLDTLAERWNGRSWTVVPTPTPHEAGWLGSVSTVSARDAWAGGFTIDDKLDFHGLFLHWNGTRWAKVATPGPALTELSAITAVSARDVWAAGGYCARKCGQVGEIDRAMLLHWNGARWSALKAPSPDPRAPSVDIASLSAVSPANVWAAGYVQVSSSGSRTLVLHWNGTRWATVASPGPRPSAQLFSVHAVSAASAWAVGQFCAARCGGDSPAQRPLILRWNGTRWARVASPNPAPASSELSGVTAASARSAWAVGSYCKGKCATQAYRTLILHWNGFQWARAAAPGLGAGQHILTGASALPSGRAWAVGETCGGHCDGSGLLNEIRPLIEAWNGRRWAVQ
jgi:hypothetical protein